MITDQYIIFSLIGFIFVFLIWGKVRYDLVAFASLVIAFILGVVPEGQVFSGFGHPAVVIIALVLIVSRGLSRSGAVDLLARWTHEFSLAVGEKSDAKAARTSAEKGIAGGRMLLWEHQGQPVSLAAAVRPTRHGVGICRVYTPPEHREHGFASACVAELSQRQLDAGREFCCLYTELANPISNSIYQKIGYIPVTDSTHCRFATAAAGSSESIEVARD